MTLPRYPFEATPEQLEANIDSYVDDFVGGLQSHFLVMPRGNDFVDFDRFQASYRTLKNWTADFVDFSADRVLAAVRQDPLVLVILRVILGFTPPELGYLANTRTDVRVDQSTARRLDKRAKEGRPLFVGTRQETQRQVIALVQTAVDLITGGPTPIDENLIHRLDKVDTRAGLGSVKRLSDGGVPYEELLYERLLGRPFASHRDAVSEHVGDTVEHSVSALLGSHNIAHHKAGVAERFEDMDQAPDFLVPESLQPSVLIEAKLAEDDGTARDKVTRIQHLAELREDRLRRGVPTFQVIACIDGRGFGIRREDVKKLLRATQGKLFTLQTVQYMVNTTSLRDFRR